MIKYSEEYHARISCNLAGREKTDEECSQNRTLNALLIVLQGLLFASANYSLPHSSRRGRR